MVLCGSWWFFNVLGVSWWLFGDQEVFCWFLVVLLVSGSLVVGVHLCLFEVFRVSRWFVIVLGSFFYSWFFLVDFGSFWWFLVFFGGFW